MAKNENFPQPNYRIKLLANDSVVLVEAAKYESEIFTPQIVNGRITFLNIIPNRRCCKITNTNVMCYANRQSQNTKILKEPIMMKTKKLEKLEANECLALRAPLANSTPASMKQERNSWGKGISNSNNLLSSTNSTLPTPEPVRRALPTRPLLLEKSMVNLPMGIPSSGIYYKPNGNVTKKIGCLVTSPDCLSGAHNSANISKINGSFRIFCSPILSSRSKKQNSISNIIHSTAIDSIATWQKVLTPIRTYTRKSKKPLMINRPKMMCSAKKPKANSKVVPNYLMNPTQGLDTTQQIEMKKCKLIIDSKTSISPRTFKKQQAESVDAHAIKSDNSLHPHSLNYHKPRPYLETLGLSAFDLLTNSNHSRVMAKKLNEQFRKGCINKASSTSIKYRVLCTVPPIENDEQVLELSSMSLRISQTNR